MKIADLRAMSEQDLIVQLISFKKESMNLRFRKVTATVGNTARMRIVKKTIAKINTLISEKKSAAQAVK